MVSSTSTYRLPSRVPVPVAGPDGRPGAAGTIAAPPQAISRVSSDGARTMTTRVEQSVLASCCPGRSGEGVVTAYLSFGRSDIERGFDECTNIRTPALDELRSTRQRSSIGLHRSGFEQFNTRKLASPMGRINLRIRETRAVEPCRIPIARAGCAREAGSTAWAPPADIEAQAGGFDSRREAWKPIDQK